MSWLQEKYPIGKQVQVEHPATDKPEAATVTAWTVEGDAAHPTVPTGIMVKFQDGHFVDVPMGRLEKDGSGT